MSFHDKTPTAKDYQEQGNASIKEGKYFEAVLKYTFAIKLDLRNAELYSNRSLAFLKTGQLYYALEDANQAIKIKPKWPKGYFRKGEVLFAANQYIEAARVFEEAHRLQPSDTNLLKRAQQCEIELANIKRKDELMPKKGIAIGILLGLGVIVLDWVLLDGKLFNFLFAQLIVIILFAVAGYYIAVLVRNQMRMYRSAQIEKPVDLLDY